MPTDVPRALVVDASVAVSWFHPAGHSEEARRLLSSEYDLLAPGLVFAEVGNAFWRLARAGLISEREARAALAAFLAVPFEVTEGPQLARAALEIGLQTGRSVYDCTYLALAATAGVQMVTADRRLVNGLAGTEWARLVLWVGDIPEGPES